uniref:N(6)-L-threonylcarbamoyladenine synthase n=1 Tax=Aceria tosichella TaxID=561515 RepID=A0A6G1S620_9ACAR
MSTSPHGIHVLGIETSCDDTGVAILRQDGNILSNCIHSQLQQHINHGGIIPMVAKEYHYENIDHVAKRAFTESGLKSVGQDIRAIAVTTRPGLDFSLQVGLNYARQLAKKYSKPLIPIHHMQAHALMPLLENRSIKFPFLALLISGGHCLLSICERYNKFHTLGTSWDGAPGELLDKIARRIRIKNLGEPYDRLSGGAAIEMMSRRPGADRFKYFNSCRSVPMTHRAGCNFSFSGYWGNFDKIAPVIDDLWRSDRELLLDELGHLCGSIQRVIFVQLFRKLQRAMMYYRMHWRHNNPTAFRHSESDPTHHLGFGIRDFESESDHLDVVISGGVAANSYMIESLRSACSSDIDPGISVYSPSKKLCSDNGLMIAWNGMLRLMDTMEERNISAVSNEDPIDYSIIECPSKMDLVKTMAKCDIGHDITKLIEDADFRLPKTLNSELKLNG